jgi:hypothetical protein
VLQSANAAILIASLGTAWGLVQFVWLPAAGLIDAWSFHDQVEQCCELYCRWAQEVNRGLSYGLFGSLFQNGFTDEPEIGEVKKKDSFDFQFI